MGSIPMHAVVPRLSGTPGEIRKPAPALGEHNKEILSGLGLSAAAIDDLRERGLVGQKTFDSIRALITVG